VLPQNIVLPFDIPPQLTQCLVLSLGFIAILLLKKRVFTPEPRKSILIWAMVIGGLGIIGLVLPQGIFLLKPLDSIIPLFSLLFTGSSGALILAYWLFCYKAFPLRITIFYVSAAGVFSAIWSILLACLLLPVAAVVLAGFPFATSLLLLSSLKLSYQQNAPQEIPESVSSLNTKPGYWRIIIGIAAFTTSFGVIRFFIPKAVEPSLNSELLLQIAVILASIIGLVIGVMTQMKSFSIVGKIALPVMVLSLLAAVVVGDAAAGVKWLAVLGFILFTNLGLIITVMFAKAYSSEAIDILVFGRLADSSGVLIGGVSGTIAGTQIQQNNMILTILCAILLLLLILVSTIVMSDKAIIEERQDIRTDEYYQHQRPWRKKCEALANQYSLTSREKEVLVLLAKGSSAESIANRLVISPHTAKTHTRNIFAKLNVHSRQTLLDLLDTTDF
jgi:DNA-binding CsgD family transcriptional regulator